MPVFTYKAADPTGRTIHRVMEALDSQAVVERLHPEGYFPGPVEAADERPRVARLAVPGRGWPRPPGPRLPARPLLAPPPHLSPMRGAGPPTDRPLGIRGDLWARAPPRSLLQDVPQTVRTGPPPADARSRHHPRPFSRL